MSDEATLLELAERAEKAGVDDQRELLIEAFKAIHGQKPHRPSGGSPEWLAWLYLFNPFFKKLEARAFLDAAMSLVPEGWAYGQGRGTDRSDTEGWAWVSPTDEGEIITAATPALALASASLRAIANKEPTT